METLLTKIAAFISGKKNRSESPIVSGKGPFAGINADDGTSYAMAKRLWHGGVR